MSNSRRNLDIIINKFGKDYISSGDGTEIQYNCPFCLKRRGKADDDHKLYVNTVSLKFHCFKCNAKGRLSSSKFKESSFGVYGKLSDLISDNQIDDNEEDNMFFVPNIEIPLDSVAYKYCAERGIDKDKIDYYDIRLGIDDLFGRIVIPNEIYSNKWTDMFSARSYLNQTPKYKNPDGAKKTHSVFNLRHIKNNPERLIIVEGCITAICAGKDAVAVYGCHPSSLQINRILEKNPENLYCVLDGDEAGKLGNNQLLQDISKSSYEGNLYYVTMPSGVDAADIGEVEFNKYVESHKERYVSTLYKKLFDTLETKN